MADASQLWARFRGTCKPWRTVLSIQGAVGEPVPAVQTDTPPLPCTSASRATPVAPEPGAHQVQEVLSVTPQVTVPPIRQQDIVPAKDTTEVPHLQVAVGLASGHEPPASVRHEVARLLGRTIDPVFCHPHPAGPCVGGNPRVRGIRDKVAPA